MLSDNTKTKVRLVFGFLTFFINALCTSQFGPFFPTEALKKGTSVLMIGLIIGSFDITGAFTAFIPLFLNLKCNKNLFLLGAIVRGLTTLSLGFTCYIENNTLYNIICIILRSLMGIGYLQYVCGMSFLISLDPKHAAIISGSIESMDAFGSIVGPPMGSFLFSQSGFSMPFVVTGSLLVTIPVLGFVVFKYPRNHQTYGYDTLPEHIDSHLNENEGRTSKTFWDFITNMSILISVLPYLAASSLSGYLIVSLSPYLKETFSIHGNTVGYYMLINSVSTTFACIITGKLTEKGYGVFLHASVTFLITVSSFLAFLPCRNHFIENIAYFLPLLAVFGICYGVASVSVLLVCENVAMIEGFRDIAKTKLFVASLWTLNFSFGKLLGSFVFGGIMLSHSGFYWTNLCISAFSMIAGLLSVVMLACKIGIFKKSYYYQQINVTKEFSN